MIDRLMVSDVPEGGGPGAGPPLAKCLAPSRKIQTELADVVILYYLALWKFRLVQWQIPANPNGFAISMSFNGLSIYVSVTKATARAVRGS